MRYDTITELKKAMLPRVSNGTILCSQDELDNYIILLGRSGHPRIKDGPLTLDGNKLKVI